MCSKDGAVTCGDAEKGAPVDETKRCKVRRPAYHGRSSRFCPTQFGDVYMILYDVLRMCHDRSVMCVAIILRS